MSHEAFRELLEQLAERPGEVYITPDGKLALLALPNGTVLAMTGEFNDATDEYIDKRVQDVIKAFMEG